MQNTALYLKYSIAIILGFSLCSHAEALDRMVSVSGTCLKQVSPDRGAIVLSSEVRGSEAKRLTVEVGRLYERVKERVNQLHIGGLELQTTEYRVEEVREWEKDKMVSKGFRAKMGLRVSASEHARLGEVADVAAREGVKDIGNLELYTSLAKLRDERNSCLKEAAEQARLKAQKLVETLGAKLGDVIAIQEASSEPTPFPRVREAFSTMANAKMADAPPTIDSGKDDLTVSVSVSFGIK